MELFYTPSIQLGLFELPEEEARHAVQVLRHQIGDQLTLVDGRGGWYQGQIMATAKRTCTLEVQQIRREQRRAGYRLHVAVAPTKRNERFEWFLEKATEIGIDHIYPIISQHSERRQIRSDRYEKVLIAAMKQSQQAWLPQLHQLQKLETLLAESRHIPQRAIAWIDASVTQSLIDTFQPPFDVLIVVGPEGGFAREEAERAIEAGFAPIQLGPNRLRTETAALVATHTVMALSQWQVPKK